MDLRTEMELALIDQASALLASPCYSEQCIEVIRIICSVLESSEKAAAKIARAITGETSISLGEKKNKFENVISRPS